MKTLLIGGTGFVGGHLAAALAGDGAQVCAFAQATSDTSRLDALGVQVTRGELKDECAIQRAVNDCDVVYHLAAVTSRTARSTREFDLVNVKYLGNVVRAVAASGVRRFVFASGAAVYGLVDAPPVNEDSPTKAQSAYAVSKVAGERLVHGAHQELNLPAVTARYPGVLGRRSLSWTGLFAAVGGGRFRMIGSGQNRTHTLHIDDLVRGLRLCGETPGIEGRTFNLASEEAVKVGDLIALIARELGVGTSTRHLPRWPYQQLETAAHLSYRWFRGQVPWVHRYELFLSDKVMSIEKAKRELGFRPTVPLHQGVRETIQWCRANRLI